MGYDREDMMEGGRGNKNRLERERSEGQMKDRKI